MIHPQQSDQDVHRGILNTYDTGVEPTRIVTTACSRRRCPPYMLDGYTCCHFPFHICIYFHHNVFSGFSSPCVPLTAEVVFPETFLFCTLVADKVGYDRLLLNFSFLCVFYLQTTLSSSQNPPPRMTQAGAFLYSCTNTFFRSLPCPRSPSPPFSLKLLPHYEPALGKMLPFVICSFSVQQLTRLSRSLFLSCIPRTLACPLSPLFPSHIFLFVPLLLSHHPLGKLFFGDMEV